ncbi:MAG: biopolymer transporter ExbD [Treponema sp.]|nr:biopolymer transporter ExbD [Treponema sp.]
MKLTRHTRLGDDPGSSGSLNDLSFLLIIFFIVTAGFNVNKGFLMRLPDTAVPRIVQKNDLLRCVLESSGTVLIDGKKMTMDGLEETVRHTLTGHPNMTFVLAIAPDTPYQNVIDVIGIIRKLGVENFSFRMEDN